jgi:DNA polymerase III delta prime subunit
VDAYDVSRLTDYDFEQLSKDVIERKTSLALEIFAPGPDTGIDLRYMHPTGASLIVQCKHWYRSGRSLLIRHMERVEYPKVVALAPERYILVTSVDLTPQSKSRLTEILGPYLASSGDLIGLGELNAFLEANPDIVRRHLRLWLNSSAILQSIISQRSIVRSRALMEEIDQSLKTYSPTPSHAEARVLLEKKHVCIIAGIPGIGKTTLAQALAAEYLAEGYEIIEVSEDVDEINQLWSDSTPQFFYYDDFLGQTASEDKLGKNEDGRIVSLIRRIGAARNKKFVLTTREYILERARSRYERIANTDLSSIKCTVDIAKHYRMARASILYNHLYHSSLPSAQVKLFASEGNWKPIIDHDNFSPRLVAISLQQAASEGVPAVQHVLSNLNNPERLWSHIIDYQLTEVELEVLFVAFSFSNLTPLETLRRAWLSYARRTDDSRSTRDFRRALETLDGTMLRTVGISEHVRIAFHNPSVRDYLGNYVSDNPKIFNDILKTIKTFEQAAGMWRTAAGHRDESLIRLLDGDIFESALIMLYDEYTTIHSTPDDIQLDTHARLLIFLDAAEKLRSSQLIGWLIFVLRRPGEDLFDGASLDSVVEFVNHIEASDIVEIRQSFDHVLAEAVSWILGDISSWTLIREAEAALGGLGDHAEHDLWALANEIKEMAQSLIKSYMEEGGGPYFQDVDELRDLVDYARYASATDEEVYPGLELAEDELQRRLDDVRPTGGTSLRPEGPQIENAQHTIQTMMHGLNGFGRPATHGGNAATI